VLLVLWEEQPQTVGALCARLYLTTGTLTPVLKRMEAAGYVTRHRDPGDERRVVVGLTAKGQALREKAVHVPRTIANGRSPDGIDELREGVRKLVALLAEQDASN
jgi:DNA-binding MarR family transcriptional regulator